MSLTVENVSLAYGRTPVLERVSLPTLAAGTVTALIGPNAAGKSSLMRCIAGQVRFTGRIRLDGQDLAGLGMRERSRRLAYLPQELPARASLSVVEAVLLAAKQEAGWLVADQDLAAVERVLARLGITALAERQLNELSGGQAQMVSLAQALVREPRVLLLDEPTSALDLRHQLEVLALVAEAARERETIVMAAVHDLNLAARHADRILVLEEGTLAAAGTPREVLTPALLEAVYGVDAIIHDHPTAGLMIQPLRPSPGRRKDRQATSGERAA